MTVGEVYEHDDELRTKLSTAKSVGDALGGDPERPNPDARGLGMARRPGGRELLVDQVNAALAVRCLEGAGYAAADIAALAGKATVEAFEDWLIGLPTRGQARAALAVPPPPREPVSGPQQQPGAPGAAEQALRPVPDDAETRDGRQHLPASGGPHAAAGQGQGDS